MSLAFWNLPPSEALRRLDSSSGGLTGEEARKRLASHGPNLLRPSKGSGPAALLLAQFSSPIVLILLFATVLSYFLHDRADAGIILAIVIVSGLLGFWQEKGAADAVKSLIAIVRINTAAVRDGRPREVPASEVVPGDVLELKAGDVVPADCLLLEANDLFVDEATLTGETFPVEKAAGPAPAEAPLARRTNSLWMGTHVISGTARALAALTGRETEFGKVSERLKVKPQVTEFERGMRQFGYFLMQVTLALVVTIFAVNVFLSRPVIDSFLFSLALAVGLTPQMLPAIISVNLSHGARRMAAAKVIVKRLAAIENLGSMNVLCSDKTGTITEGRVRFYDALDESGASSERVLLHAYLNSFYETGFVNPIDEAVRAHRKFDLSAFRKEGEIPYDFVRKRLSILVSRGGGRLMVTKGALESVLAACSRLESAKGGVTGLSPELGRIRRKFEEFSDKGYRVLGVAYKEMGPSQDMAKDEESDMVFSGFLVFLDPPKKDIADTISALKKQGVALKIITGDNRLVAASVAREIGLAAGGILTGPELESMSDGALERRAADTGIFAEIEPNQKERIILALRRGGAVVGYMGDGINDASALHAADVGVSVDSAVDVAKEAADIVLLGKDLGVLVQGVREGRMTFANTLKYVFMATSANFGNMFSMAGASLFMPFLPLLPKQILLTNLITDCPQMTISSDGVDAELVDRPGLWDMKAVRKFMLTFGFVSSFFDYLTFGALIFLLHAPQAQFRTAWFVESVVSASLVVLVVRTRRPFFRSRPGKYLSLATLAVAALALLLPFTPLAGPFGFAALPARYLLLVGGIVVLYIAAAEAAKTLFYRKTAL